MPHLPTFKAFERISTFITSMSLSQTYEAKIVPHCEEEMRSYLSVSVDIPSLFAAKRSLSCFSFAAPAAI
jgi:hypothetical protein